MKKRMREETVRRNFQIIRTGQSARPDCPKIKKGAARQLVGGEKMHSHLKTVQREGEGEATLPERRERRTYTFRLTADEYFEAAHYFGP